MKNQKQKTNTNKQTKNTHKQTKTNKAQAWVMAAARKLFGPSPLATVSVLVAPTVHPLPLPRPAARAHGQRLPLETLARPTGGTGAGGAGAADRTSSDAGGAGATCSNTTTASGIGGTLPDGTGVGLLLTVFNQAKSCTDPVSVSVTFEHHAAGKDNNANVCIVFAITRAAVRDVTAVHGVGRLQSSRCW